MLVTRFWVFALVICRSRSRRLGSAWYQRRLGADPENVARGAERAVRPVRRNHSINSKDRTDIYVMATHVAKAQTARRNHFSCTMSAVLLAQVAGFGGQKTVQE